MKKHVTNPKNTILSILLGLIVLYWWLGREELIIVAFVLGLIGLFSPRLSQIIDFLWMKLAWLLSLIVPNILLSFIFYVLLFPIAMLSRIFGAKDPLFLKNTRNSTFREVNKTFDPASFERPW